MDMNGICVKITGASRGIGAAAARAFVQAGASVVLSARDKSALDALAEELGPRALAVACDVSDFAQVQAATQAAVDHFGRLDVLINNAGVIDPITPMAEADPDAWTRAIDVNLKGVFHGMRAALPVMKSAGGGTILTISSGAAHGPHPAWSAYCASKAGVAMLTRSLDMEERANGIRAMGLSPGTVATDMQRVIRKTGIGRVGQLEWSDHIPPEWVAQALLWMASPAGDAHLGEELSLRDPDWRRELGLTE